MFDIKIECMRLARRSAAKGAGKAGWRHVNDSAVTAASFYVGPNGGPLVEGGRSGTSGLRDAAALLITLSQGATMQDRNRRLYDA
jgi:hypothetical protein